METKVFLGGTCGNNDWRNGFISRLSERGVDSNLLFDPVVDDWNEEAQRREDAAKDSAEFMLFYLGDPRQDDNRNSFYSLCEAMLGLIDSHDRTIIVFDTSGMPNHAVKSSEKTLRDLNARFPNAAIFPNLPAVEDFIAEQYGNSTVTS